jgi:hypothetical protein
MSNRGVCMGCRDLDVREELDIIWLVMPNVNSNVFMMCVKTSLFELGYFFVQCSSSS